MPGAILRLSGFFLTVLLSVEAVGAVRAVLSLLKEARKESSIFINLARVDCVLVERILKCAPWQEGREYSPFPIACLKSRCDADRVM